MIAKRGPTPDDRLAARYVRLRESLQIWGERPDPYNWTQVDRDVVGLAEAIEKLCRD